MRKLAVLLVLALAFAGCSGDGDDSSSSSTTGSSSTTHTHTTTTTTTPAKPNVPPEIVLKVTPANVTLVGGNLTFDASASADPDGDGISAIAIALKTNNGTLPAKLLYSAGQSTPQTFKMDVPGPVNVTVSAVDKRNGLTTERSTVYVNQKATVGANANFAAAIPAQAAEAESCKGRTSVPQLDATNWAKREFPVHAGTSYVTATFVSGTGEIALCAPDGTAISGAATTGTVMSNAGVVFTAPQGGSYFVSVYSGAPNQSVVVEVVAHSEPRPA